MRAGGAAMAGERKQVTVMFADVQGSMELAERTDPETLRRVMDRFFAILSEGVHRFEGTVDKFTGDGIMALFGAPIAHEDHARRACYAALELRERLAEYEDELRRSEGLNFSVRVGINSGEVVVGSIGEDLELSYTAIGQTVGLAQRMEQLAAPGSAYLTEHTAALVQGFFELRDLGSFEVKGLSDPIGVHELTGIGTARTRLEVSRQRGFSRFVGRDEELSGLVAALERAHAGEGQVIGVVGEPGVGKSRLCYELVEHCRDRGMSVYQTAALAHARSVPLLPVLDLMRDYYGVAESDPAQAVREKVAGRLLLLDPDFQEDLPLVFEFLGVPDPERPAASIDPEARKQRLIGLVHRLVHTQAAREPGLTLIEDLHWIDPSSDEFLAGLVDAVKDSNALVLVNFRPEYEASWMSADHYAQIDLEPLGDVAVSELLDDLLGSDPSVDGLDELIVERTGGNPFFVEEVVQELAESGALDGAPGSYRLSGELERISVPATVQSVLAARIDRIGEPGKSVLQAAAVLGREFPRAVLSRVVGRSADEIEPLLSHLVEAEFVNPVQLYPEPEYGFKHPLTQEVAYRSLLGERRRELHAAAATATAELYPERSDENAALVASHWEAADDSREAAGWHARAASWAGFRDPVPTLGHWRRVRELAAELPEDNETASLEMTSRIAALQFGWRLGISDEEASVHFERGLAIAERRGDAAMRALLNNVYATTALTAGRIERALEVGLESVRIADETGDPALRIAMRTGPAYALFTAGRLDEALEMTETGIEVGRQDPSQGRNLGLTSPYAFCVMFRGALLTNFGRIAEAREVHEVSMEVARREGDLEAEGWCWANRAHFGWTVGELDAAVSAGASGIEVAERVGDVFSRSWSRCWYGIANAVAEHWDEAIGALETSLEMTRAKGTGVESEPWRLAWLAEAYRGSGDVKRALELIDEAAAIGERNGNRGTIPVCEWLRARALLAARGVDAAAEIEAALERSERAAEEIGYAVNPGWINIERAELAALQGDGEARERRLREAREVFERTGAGGWLRRVDDLLGTPAG